MWLSEASSSDDSLSSSESDEDPDDDSESLTTCFSLTVFARKFWLGFFAFKRWRSWFKRQSFTSKCRVFFEFKRRFVRDISWTKLTGSLFVCYFLFVSASVLNFLTKFVGVAQAAKWIGWRKCRVILTSFYALASHVKFF